jgi:hypothetical protein
MMVLTLISLALAVVGMIIMLKGGVPELVNGLVYRLCIQGH